MPEGAIDYQTIASSSLGGEMANTYLPHRIAPGRLVPATNLISVEVHLSDRAANSLDFDLALIGNLPANPPTISITKPNNYSLVYDLSECDWEEVVLIEGGPVTVCAEVSSIDSAVTNVEFFANGERIGSVTRPPFCLAWSNLNACSYTLTARATDESGISGTSDEVSIIVSSPQQPTYLIPPLSLWRIFHSGPLVPPDWRASDFDDSDWDSAFSTFGNNTAATSSFLVGDRTLYFRHYFDVPAAAGFTNLNPIFFLWFGEGAVFYLNGVEIFRTNMLPGEPTFETRSTNGVPAITNPTNIFLLRTGENVLAIEVHQPANPGLTLFDFALEATRAEPLPELTSCLRLIKTPWGYAYVAWGDPAAWELEQADQITGPWYPAGYGGKIFVDTSFGQKFYRLRHY